MAQIVGYVEESLANEYVPLAHGVLDALVLVRRRLQRLSGGQRSWRLRRLLARSNSRHALLAELVYECVSGLVAVC